MKVLDGINEIYKLEHMLSIYEKYEAFCNEN